MLYHGTSITAAPNILTGGIAPRGALESTWKDCPSRHDLVYLTKCYAPYFAVSTGSDEIVIIEVDDKKLDEASLFPDEDFLAQTCVAKQVLFELGVPQRVIDGKMNDRVAWFRDNLELFKSVSSASLVGLGTCAHLGPVSLDAVERIVSFDCSNQDVLCAIDPVVTCTNFKIFGRFYEELTKWFFDPDVDYELLSEFGLNREELSDRRGLKRLR